MNSPNAPVKSDLPEIPPEVARRGKIALTANAAETENLDEYRNAIPDPRTSTPGMGIDTGPAVVKLKKSSSSRSDAELDRQIEQLNALSKMPPGYQPHFGMSAAQIDTVMALRYDGQPDFGPAGDLTPEFIVWLYENYPRDAHVRYYTRLMPNLGMWIERAFPDFVYQPKVITAPRMDFSIPPTIGRELTTVESLRKELAELKAKKERESAESEEVVKLRREIAILKGETPLRESVAELTKPQPPKKRPNQFKKKTSVTPSK